MATAVLEVPVSANDQPEIPKADPTINKLAIKCIEIGKRIWKFNHDAAEFERSQFGGESFKKWFSKNVKHIVELRSKFPSVNTPGSHKKLTLSLERLNADLTTYSIQTHDYSWEEFVNLHMSITLQYLNRLLDEYAPEAKPAKPKREFRQKPNEEKPLYKHGYQKAMDEVAGKLKALGASTDAIVLAEKVGELERQVEDLTAQNEELDYIAGGLQMHVDELEANPHCEEEAPQPEPIAPALDEHSARSGAVAYFKRLGSLKSQVHEFEQILKAQGLLSKVSIVLDEEE